MHPTTLPHVSFVNAGKSLDIIEHDNGGTHKKGEIVYRVLCDTRGWRFELGTGRVGAMLSNPLEAILDFLRNAADGRYAWQIDDVASFVVPTLPASIARPQRAAYDDESTVMHLTVDEARLIDAALADAVRKLSDGTPAFAAPYSDLRLKVSAFIASIGG